MKAMRRIAAWFLAIGIVLSFASCGSDNEEHTVVMRCETSMFGMSVTDTVTMTAIGDNVQSYHEVLEFDISTFLDLSTHSPDEEKERLVNIMLEVLERHFGNIDAITMEDISVADTTLTVTLLHDFTGDLTALDEAGYIGGDTGTGYISLTKTQKTLESRGYIEIEQSP